MYTTEFQTQSEFLNQNEQQGFQVAPGSGSDAYQDLFTGLGDHIRNCLNPDLNSIHRRIASLAALPEDWDGIGSLPATFECVRKAIDWARGMKMDAALAAGAVASSILWRDPIISLNEKGEVLFEWKLGKKGLYVYVSETQVDYIKSPGTRVISEMEDGTINSGEDNKKLWLWLIQ